MDEVNETQFDDTQFDYLVVVDDDGNLIQEHLIPKEDIMQHVAEFTCPCQPEIAYVVRDEIILHRRIKDQLI